jgi:hypothetical protein
MPGYCREWFQITGYTNCWPEEDPINGVPWRYDWCVVCYECGYGCWVYLLIAL